MTDPLKVIILEDDPKDATILERAIQLAPILTISMTVSDRAGLIAALKENQPWLTL